MPYITIIAVLLLIPASLLANDNWIKSSFDLSASLSHTTKESLDLSNISTAQFKLNKTELFDGWAIQFSQSLSLKQASHLNSYFQNNSKVKSKLFINDSSALNFVLQSSDELIVEDKSNSTYVSLGQTSFSTKNSALGINYQLGSDGDFWLLTTDVSSSSIDRYSLDTKSKLGTDEKVSFEINSFWRLSEDTYLASSFSNIESKVRLDINYNESITNSYLGFKTKYLKSSAISFLIGNSQNLQRQNQLSWRFEHKTFINDYSSIAIATRHAYELSSDFDYEYALQHTSTVKFEYKASDLFAVQFNLQQEDGQLNNIIDKRKLTLDTGLQLNYLEQWQASLTFSYEDYADDRSNFNYHQNKLSIQVSRDLI